mgnify:CR=1 FL=1
MATKRGFRRSVQIRSHKFEDTYGTDPEGASSGVNIWSVHKGDMEAANLTSELVNDTDLILGPSAEEATTLVELSRSTSGSLSFTRVKPHNLATVVAFAFNGGRTASPLVDVMASLGSSTYRHVMKPAVGDFELASFNLYDELDANVLGYLYLGCLMNDFTLSCERKGWWNLQANYMGSGARTEIVSGGSGRLGCAFYDGDSNTEDALDIAEPPLKGGDSTVYIVDGGAAGTGGLDGSPDQGAEDLTGTVLAGFNAKVVSFNWGYSNNIDETSLHEFNSGLLKARGERMRRSQTLSMTVEFADNVELAWLTDQDTLSIEVDTVSSVSAGAKYFGFDLMFPLTKLLSASVSGGSDKMLVDLEFQILQHGSAGSVQIDVYNQRSAAYCGT